MVVLSNNDGCAVARSAEVKALGVKMGAPWFKLKELAKEHGIIVYSSNYTLYGDMSNRVMTILRDFSPDIEVYSIDESFLRVESVLLLHESAVHLGHTMRSRIRMWTGLPVCVGFGPSKTLAKLANHLAKKNAQFNGVCDLTSFTHAERDSWMSRTETNEVWGVGRRIAERLKRMNVHSVLDLCHASPKMLRTHFGVVMERVVCELQGESCLALEEVSPPKKQIMASRSFGSPVYTIEDLGEAVSSYVARAAEKLRRQSSMASAVHVFIHTSPFDPKEPLYSAGLVVPMPNPTDDTVALTHGALAGLDRIYKLGPKYKKAGVMLMGLTDKSVQQGTLFDETTVPQRSSKMMATMDALNGRFGRDKLRLASSGLSRDWAMRSGNCSPKYTTSWHDVPIVR